MTRKEYEVHKKIFDAWAKGAEVEYYIESEDIWAPADTPTWNLNMKYRIKPKGKFIYPLWFKNKELGFVVKFTNLTQGSSLAPCEPHTAGCERYDWIPHTNKDVWEQVEKPIYPLYFKSIETNEIFEFTSPTEGKCIAEGKSNNYRLNETITNLIPHYFDSQWKKIEKPEITFPAYFISKNSSEGNVVFLFTGFNTGTVIVSNNKCYKIGDKLTNLQDCSIQDFWKKLDEPRFFEHKNGKIVVKFFDKKIGQIVNSEVFDKEYFSEGWTSYESDIWEEINSYKEEDLTENIRFPLFAIQKQLKILVEFHDRNSGTVALGNGCFKTGQPIFISELQSSKTWGPLDNERYWKIVPEKIEIKYEWWTYTQGSETYEILGKLLTESEMKSSYRKPSNYGKTGRYLNPLTHEFKN